MEEIYQSKAAQPCASNEDARPLGDKLQNIDRNTLDEIPGLEANDDQRMQATRV